MTGGGGCARGCARGLEEIGCVGGRKLGMLLLAMCLLGCTRGADVDDDEEEETGGTANNDVLDARSSKSCNPNASSGLYSDM